MTMDNVAGKYVRKQGRGPRNIRLMRGGAVVQNENMVVNGHRCGRGELNFSSEIAQSPLTKVLQERGCVQGRMITGIVHETVVCHQRPRLGRNQSLTVFIAKRNFTLQWRSVLPVGDRGNLIVQDQFHFTSGRKYLLYGSCAVYVERVEPVTSFDTAPRMRPKISPGPTSASTGKGDAPPSNATSGENRHNVWNWAGPLVGALATILAAAVTAFAAWKFQFSIPIVMRSSHAGHRVTAERDSVPIGQGHSGYGVNAEADFVPHAQGYSGYRVHAARDFVPHARRHSGYRVNAEADFVPHAQGHSAIE